MSTDTITNPSGTRRLASIDALRGFDMLMIMGMDQFVRVLASFARPGNTTWLGQALRGLEGASDQLVDLLKLRQFGIGGFRMSALAAQFEHVPWDGFRFYDLIFPLFLFLVGVVLPFSLGKYGQGADGRRRAMYRAFVRFLMLMFLALAYAGLFKLDLANMRWPGVLQRIAICYFVAAWVVILMPPIGQSLAAFFFVGVYAALLLYFPVPEYGKGDFSMAGNVSSYVDQKVLIDALGSKTCCYPNGDNEGVASTLGAIGTTLLGVLAGHLLRGGMPAWSKFLLLAIAGGACVWGGLALSPTIPIIKNIWTPTFVLYAGGWSLLLLAAFYGVIDGLGWRWWAFFFVVIGVNAITIYVAPRIIDFNYAAQFFLGGLAKQPAMEPYARLLGIGGVLAMKWLFLYFLYRKQIFLRA